MQKMSIESEEREDLDGVDRLTIGSAIWGQERKRKERRVVGSVYIYICTRNVVGGAHLLNGNIYMDEPILDLFGLKWYKNESCSKLNPLC